MSFTQFLLNQSVTIQAELGYWETLDLEYEMLSFDSETFSEDDLQAWDEVHAEYLARRATMRDLVKLYYQHMGT